jgi:lysophospholipase L1-like esterase
MSPVGNSIRCGSADAGRLAGLCGAMTALTAVGLFGSVALLPLVALQGAVTRRRVPCLPPVQPCHGVVPGRGSPIRMVVIGESTVAGVGLAHGDETVAATTARALARHTRRPVAWHGHGLSGATVSEAAERLLPQIAAEPADLLVIAFGVNDTIAYRPPSAFADDLAALVTAARAHMWRIRTARAARLPIRRCALTPGWRRSRSTSTAAGTAVYLHDRQTRRELQPARHDLRVSAATASLSEPAA